jgi:1,4-alpha-glucan branching enzyme
MKPEDLKAIIGGYHADPFSVLGAHLEKGRWRVCTFQPAAEKVELLLTKSVTKAMTCLDEAGLFETTVDQDPGAYQLIVHASGGKKTVDDPYRFPPLITAHDLHLHGEGTLQEAWNMFGAHLLTVDGVAGVRFAVWAPDAYLVTVIGDFNDWDIKRHAMRLRDGGVWELFLPGVQAGSRYKYFIHSRHMAAKTMKADPFAFKTEIPPDTASIVRGPERHAWTDAKWMEERGNKNWLEEPISIYEVHLESWMRHLDGRTYSYRELASRLIPYVKEMGFTHLELMPILEHPYSGSWGYQVTGFFAPTSRFGPPEDFQFFVDECHRQGVGVILDWVPAHFPKDAHGLARFDGTALYEHADPRQGEHTDWGTLIFNYGRNEVRAFLISSALYWLKEFHIDGFRVDAVTSMLFLNYSRKDGEWIPNRYGGAENLEAISFLKQFNEAVHAVPGAISIAEEATSFGGVSRPTYANGLGFTFKWNMGWMHDMLGYFKRDPLHRSYHQNSITFSLVYAFTENFLLPISHDEVVHGKSSLIGRMQGDEWQRFANARAFFSYMFFHPGKKLLFMGCELGQYEEWNYRGQIRWDLLQFDYHRKLQNCVAALNELYRREKALHEVEFHWDGFQWIDISDYQQSIISFLRRGKLPEDELVVIGNFTPNPHYGYAIGVGKPGVYREIFNSDSELFGGSNLGNGGKVVAIAEPRHGFEHSVRVTVPPLGVVVFKAEKAATSAEELVSK